MVADVTVTRLADDRFRVVTGAGYLASELAWLRTHADDDEAVTIRDVSGDLATIGLWGPRARDVLVAAGAPADEVGNDALPTRRTRAIRVGPAPGRCRPHQLRRRTGLGADDPDRLGCRPSGIACAPPAPTSASNPSATEPSTPSAWRRATATSAPT